MHLCRAGGQAPPGTELIAVKAYRSKDVRSFKNDGMYRAGLVIKERRIRVALDKKTKFGRAVSDGMWLNHEFDTLKLLHGIGADVPRPYAMAETSLAMEYIGDEGEAAPHLRHADLTPAEAKAACDRLLWNVELWLRHRVIHGDLSPFNVLWWDGRITVIDFPQAVNAQKNPHAQELLARDVANVCAFFARHGVRTDPHRVTADLWNRFIFGAL